MPVLQDTLYCRGDVISLFGDDGCTYYAIVRGFVTESIKLENLVALTWLLPKEPMDVILSRRVPYEFLQTDFIQGI